MKRSNNTLRMVLIIIGTIFILTGAVFGGGGVFMHQLDKSGSDRCTETAQAEVVEMVPGSESGTYAPKFRFTADGREYIVQLNSYSSPPKYHVGDKTDIRYDPDDPSLIYDDSDKLLFFMKIGFVAFGALDIIIGLVLLIIAAKIRKQARNTDELSYYNNYNGF